MSKFYLTDPNIINAALTDKEFRIYHYCCSNYNVQKRSAYIRIVDIAGLFQLTKKEVEELLIKLSQVKVNDLPLISMKQEKFISFDMPSHKKFIESLGFKKYSNQGFRTLNGHFKQIQEAEQNIVRNYIYPTLDQYELLEKLEDLPTEELNKIKDHKSEKFRIKTKFDLFMNKTITAPKIGANIRNNSILNKLYLTYKLLFFIDCKQPRL